MKPISFDFLDNIELESVEKASTRLGTLEKQPEGSRIRLFADGKVYPSQELIEKFQLQYVAKGNPDQGNGFDVFSTKDWGQWPINAGHDLMLIAAVSKNLAKVDLFASTRYDDEGNPRADVGTQGAHTFGKLLIENLKETYGEDFFADGRIFLDLEIKEDKPLRPSNNGVYTVPKPITKGKNAGKLSYERRENITIYPLVPVVDETVEQPSATEAGDTATAIAAPSQPQAETPVNQEAVPTPDEMEAATIFNN